MNIKIGDQVTTNQNYFYDVGFEVTGVVTDIDYDTMNISIKTNIGIDKVINIKYLDV